MAKYKKPTIFPCRVSTGVTAEVMARIEGAADRFDDSVAGIVRAALVRGLPLEIESRRKQRGSVSANGTSSGTRAA